MNTFRLGTRGSRLALAQAESISRKLSDANPGLYVEIVPIKTSGDRGDREVVGAFVREIQHAILHGEIDAGLHCLKDLPVEDVHGLYFAAYLEREDSRDALIGKYGKLDDLPEGALVGTGSLRRTAQLAAKRPDLRFHPIMGNIDTRLGKLLDGQYDAIVLAIAGIIRLGLLEDWGNGPYKSLKVEPLEMEEMLPAAGQAVLVLETRSDDPDSKQAVKMLDHEPSKQAAIAERAFLKGFGGGCSIPVASRAIVENGILHLRGLVAEPSGVRVLSENVSGPVSEALSLAAGLVDTLSDQGAKEIVERATVREVTN